MACNLLASMTQLLSIFHIEPWYHFHGTCFCALMKNFLLTQCTSNIRHVIIYCWYLLSDLITSSLNFQPVSISLLLSNRLSPTEPISMIFIVIWSLLHLVPLNSMSHWWLSFSVSQSECLSMFLCHYISGKGGFENPGRTEKYFGLTLSNQPYLRPPQCKTYYNL